MKVTLNISEFNYKTFEDTEYPATVEENIGLIPIGKSGIRIKKENRGSFTEYCGGKVTDACIKKAKNSSSSKLRKQAVFAENARGWARKHQEGGVLLKPIPGVDTSTSDISKFFVSYSAMICSERCSISYTACRDTCRLSPISDMEKSSSRCISKQRCCLSVSNGPYISYSCARYNLCSSI